MTNNRTVNASLAMGASTQRTSMEMQLRNSVFPVIELGGQASQSVSASTWNNVNWSEIIRQTDQPLNEWRGNNVGNYVWPVFISAGSGSDVTRVRVNVSGYYQIFFTFTWGQLPNTFGFSRIIINHPGSSVTTGDTNYLWAGPNRHDGYQQNITTFIPAGSDIRCQVWSTVANTIISDTKGAFASNYPSPRLIITQLAQSYDDYVGKSTRVVGQTQIVSSSTSTLATYTGFGNAGASNNSQYQNGGSNQLGAFSYTQPTRIYFPYIGYYIMSASMSFNQSSGLTTSRTRILTLTFLNGYPTATQSCGVTASDVRTLSVTYAIHISTATFSDTRFWTDANATAGVAIGSLSSQKFSVTYLG